MGDSSLQDRLRAHAQAFDGLLSLIPAKLYYGNGDEPSEQWRRKKQTKAEKQAARRANLDPENALNKSVKEVLEERAASSKRKLAAITGAGTNGEPDDSKDAGDVEEAEGAEKAGNDDDDDEDDGSSVDGIVKEKPGEGLKKAKAKAKTAEVGETASKKAKLSNGEENKETDNKMEKKEGEDEDENGDDDDEDGGGIRLVDANLSAKQQKKLLKKQAKAERRAEKRKSKAKKTEPREKATDIVDEAPKDAVKEDLKDTEEQQENGENNDDVDGNDNASAADDLNDTSFAALAAEQDAPSSPSAASSVASPVFDTTLLTADDAADADADAAATTATTTSSVSSTATTTTTTAPDQKHKISVPADTAALRARLAAKIEALRAARKADAARMTRDADGQLVVISTRQQLIEARRQKQAERKQHKKELRRAAREEEERQREAAVASARGSPLGRPASAAAMSAEVDMDVDTHYAFGRIAFADGAELSRDLSYVKGGGDAAGLGDKKKRKGPAASDIKGQLARLEAQKTRLASLDDATRREVEEKERWLAARKRAEGAGRGSGGGGGGSSGTARTGAGAAAAGALTVAGTAPTEVLLKKALKRKEQAKKKSAKAWAERIEGVARAGQERQAKRQANLRARREDKQLHRAGLSKKAKKGSKSGSGKGRPGFEGTFGGRRK